MYHILIKSQIIKVSYDMSKIKKDLKKIPMKISRDFKKMIFFLHFLASDISLNNLFLSIKLDRHVD